MAKKKVFEQKQSDIKQDNVAPLEKVEAPIEELDLEVLIKKQEVQIKEAENQRGDFISKQNKWFRQRYGLRKKATFPWYNASSQHLPKQDTTIRKMKPEYVAVAWSTSPICELTTKESTNMEVSESASWHFDWLLRTRMDIFSDLVLMADKMLHKGFCIVKTIYERIYEPKIITITKTELEEKLTKTLLDPSQASIISDPNQINVLIPLMARIYDFDLEDENDKEKVTNICLELYKGTEVIEFTVSEKVYDAPKLIVLDPEEVIVPSDTLSTFDLEGARWICHQYYVTVADVLSNARTGRWNKETCIGLLEKNGVYEEDIFNYKYEANGIGVKDTTSLQQKRQREGLDLYTGSTEKSILIKEVCLKLDLDKDGIEERYILEYAEGGTSELRFIRYPYTFLKSWPYAKVPFSIEDNRHYSVRGTVEMEEPLAAALNVQHNMKINRQTIASTPTLLYAANKVNPNNFQYIPGQAVPVEPPLNANVQWFMPQNTDQTFIQEENILKSWADELLAANDYGSNRVQQGKTTATEINYNASSRVGIRQLDIQVWQKALKEIYKRVFLLWLEFSKDAVFQFQDGDGEIKLIDKASLNRDYQFQPMGSFGSSNPQLSAQIAARMFEVLQGRGDIDQYELLREFVTKQGDPRLAKRILKTKKQILEDQKNAQEAQKAQHAQDLQEQIILAQAGAAKPVNKQMPMQRDMRGAQQIQGNNKGAK